MVTCNPYFWMALYLGIGGIFALFASGRRKSKEGHKPSLRRLTLIGIIMILLAVGIYGGAVASYAQCTRTTGPCPTGFPAGSTGYRCTNEYTQCSWTGNCLTVAGYWPWDSDCECKCENSNPNASTPDQ